MLRKIFDFFIYSSCYIALCAVVMLVQTSELLLGNPPSGRLVGFIFFAAICSYNFHWYLTPNSVNSSRRTKWTINHKALHFIFYLAGAIGAAIYFFSLRTNWIALSFGAFVTFLYSAPKIPHPAFKALKKIAVGKTIFLSFVWMYVTTVLPIVVVDAPWNGSFILFAAGRFFLIYAICIIFDYRDREDDKRDGIRSLITYFNEKGIDRIFAGSLVLFAVCTIGLTSWHFPAFYILLLLIPGIIVAALYQQSKRDFSDFLYYVVLDGLMMFSGLLMLIFRI